MMISVGNGLNNNSNYPELLGLKCYNWMESWGREAAVLGPDKDWSGDCFYCTGGIGILGGKLGQQHRQGRWRFGTA